MSELKTVRRNKLLRDINKGLYVGKCDGVYTDDYAYDNSNNYGVTELLEIHIKGDIDFRDGYLNLSDSYFKSKSGMAYKSIREIGVHFSVHSNRSYTLVLKSELKDYLEQEKQKEIEYIKTRDAFDQVKEQFLKNNSTKLKVV